MPTLLDDLTTTSADIRAWRHHIHRHPELAFQEAGTAAFIAGLLRDWGYDVAEGVGGTGIVASLSSGSSGRAIGLRADMDALPMDEDTDAAHRSLVPGVSHMCGHDGHSAMLLGAARHLARTRRFDGTVRLIFQPAEEVMGGARAMMRDGLFDRFPMQAMFGLHNMPGLPQGKLFFTSGPVMAAVDNWEIVITGKGGHGSMPEATRDAVVAGAALVMALQTIVSRNIAAKEQAVVTVGAFLAGDAGNVIAHSATLRLSIRTTTPEARVFVLDRIRAIARAQCESYQVSCAISEGEPGAVLVNDPAETASCAEIARRVVGEDNVITPGPTFMGSEDFAFFAEAVPCSYGFIGNGDTPMVHHPRYAFDDRNLPIGAAYWAALAEAHLG
ncbi:MULTISPECIES: M20 aminoacylase family protein [unclassified Acidiphilium]|uniref:M20 aminoacylase family protein n=1 Tax=unclassified Acidiphilium TaxID=2617493 RepID=UPI000BC68BEB|nr:MULTISPECIES: M20 aminoacylase family protein [unclassified Acidiphilium]OYV56902.1 MAG: amidohydrolase [Acidiphilium sp. 20-67-58]OYV86411.1 MAG: amidohydrolase [Acidiphilium sp. 21-68-69]HQT60923.1 M20 aminoacylase family protein [Acidiphilium sp.]